MPLSDSEILERCEKCRAIGQKIAALVKANVKLTNMAKAYGRDNCGLDKEAASGVVDSVFRVVAAGGAAPADDDAQVARLRKYAGSLGGVVADHNAQLREMEMSLRNMLRETPIGEWVEETHGIGWRGMSLVIAAVGSPHRFATVSRMWKYCGWAPGSEYPHSKGGKAMVPRGGGKALTSQAFRTVINHSGPYREVYLAKKAKYLAAGRAPWQADRDARRCAIKEVLKDIWVQWTTTMPAPAWADGATAAVAA